MSIKDLFQEILSKIYEYTIWIYDHALCLAVKNQSLATFLIGGSALYIAFRNYFSTRGHDIRVLFSCGSKINFPARVTEVLIENRKNRTEVIFEIFLKINRSYGLLVGDYRDDPIIIKPFEVKIIKPEEPYFYAIQTTMVNLEKELLSEKHKKSIFLVTTTGTVKAKINRQINPPLVTKTLFDPTFGCIIPYGKEMKDHSTFKDKKEEDALILPHYNLVSLFFLRYWIKIKNYFYIKKANKKHQQKKQKK